MNKYEEWIDWEDGWITDGNRIRDLPTNIGGGTGAVWPTPGP